MDCPIETVRPEESLLFAIADWFDVVFIEEHVLGRCVKPADYGSSRTQGIWLVDQSEESVVIFVVLKKKGKEKMRPQKAGSKTIG